MSKTNPYFDPKNDLLFKRVFGEHEHLLRSFLNAVLPLSADAPIETLEYLTPEQVPEVPGLFKNSIVDVKCRDAKGRIFIVEMQMLWSAWFEQRIVFGASQAYVKQSEPGLKYKDLQPVYALVLVNETFDHKTPDYYHHYKIVNVLNSEQTLKGLEFVLIELPKFKPSTFTEKKMQAKWLTFMSQIDENTQTVAPELEADVDIAFALDLVKVAALSNQEIDAYHSCLDKARLEAGFYDDAKQLGLAEGRAEGIVEGRAEGIVEGRAEGIVEGRAEGIVEGRAEGIAQGIAKGVEQGEHQRALAIAKQLLDTGMAVSRVAEITGLDVGMINSNN